MIAQTGAYQDWADARETSNSNSRWHRHGRISDRYRQPSIRECRLEATTKAMAKLNSDAARANSETQAQRDAERAGQHAQAGAIVQAQLQDNAAKARAQANLATQKTVIRKN
jgi:hypothetical protein